MKAALISLGCSKNQVDSEIVLSKLAKGGFLLTQKLQEAEVIVINTCAFIHKARLEAHQTIKEVIKEKRPHQKLICIGCLAQLEGKKLFKKYPEIDAILGSADFYRIDQAIRSEEKFSSISSSPFYLASSSCSRILSTPSTYAYLKIAEGCSNNCSYCLIPELRGRYRSRPLEDIIKEAGSLARAGVKELILIAQDTTFYGWDLGDKFLLPKLLLELAKISEIAWIRLLYTHPAHFTPELIKEVARIDKVCKYLDLPLQHTSDRILKSMGRPESKVVFSLIERLREEIPRMVLRTTMMVGFPGETAQEFGKLLKDVQRLRFDWLGAFPYSKERGTKAFSFGQRLSKKTAMERYKEIMTLQQEITYSKNLERVGQTFSILADWKDCGHTFFQSPEIDGQVLFQRDRKEGELFKAEILEVKEVYDLIS